VIVENRTGADGRIGIQSVKAAVPDGDTLLMTTGPTMWLMPLVHKAPGYDPFNDFEPISHLTSIEFCIAVSNASGLKSLPELVAWAKANPDKATYGIPAVGTIPHFIGVALAKQIGVDMRRLPYRGGALAMNDLVAGQIPIAVVALSDAIQHHRGGSVRIVGIPSKQRSPFLPDVPTLNESGLSIDGEAWYGLWAPAKTPPAVVERINTAVVATIRDAEVKQRLDRFGLVPTGTSAARLVEIMRENTAQWSGIVKESGYTMEQ
jgi:tripartite-type tricarboxylate transporter receptor subunit TctC